MRLRGLGGALLSLLLAGCGVLDAIAPDPQFKFAPYQPQIPSGAIGYTLEASAISLNPPDKDSSKSLSCDSATWWTCLVGVTATSIVVAPDSKTFPDDVYRTKFVVIPDNSFGNRITMSYSLAGTPIADNELLLKQIIISSQDNLDNIIKDAGAGAAAGFAFGPVGAAVGGGIGAAGGIWISEDSEYSFNARAHIAPQSIEPIDKMVCKGDLDAANYDLKQLNKAAESNLALPVVVKPGPATNWSDGSQAADSSDKNCWHIVPNNSRPNLVGSNLLRTPQKGDGWFYRFVDKNSFADPETNIDSGHAPNPTSSKNNNRIVDEGNKLPVSACHEVTLQIAWWHALEDHVVSGADTRSVSYDLEVADPGEITTVTVPKSGSINFRLVCGAYATNTFAGPPLSALMTDLTSQVSAVEKAQPGSK